MCGIGGILHPPEGGPVQADRLGSMRDLLRHRGPDDSGVMVEGRVGLCHTRLSVLDLSPRAKQPMVSSSGRYVLTFNGEIYNYREIRASLIQGGRIFKTEGDSEVILELMEAEGVSGLEQLRGMFAFGIYDRKLEQMILMRDRLGIKPLFYRSGPGGIIFASEPKALGAHVESPSAHRIAEYLAFRHNAERESLEPSVETLLPGQRLVTDGRQHRIETWWQAAVPENQGPSGIERCIQEAVQGQLLSDVPVGVFLSGGVDSALVTAAAAEALSSVDTFTVGFNEIGWDESARSRRVSEALGTQSHLITLSPEEYVRDLGRAIWHLDGPLNHAHSVHLLRLAAYARQHVTVALTGEGGDELFGGYPRYRLHRLALMLGHLPQGLLRPFARAKDWLPARGARLLEEALRGERGGAALNAAFAPIGEAARLAGCRDLEAILEPRTRIFQETRARGADAISGLLALERRTYMVSLLQRMDRMSMAVGLECRVPLMDESVFEQAAKMKSRSLLNLRETKIPLRRAAAARFGRSYANLPKSGFGVPVGHWLREDTPFRKLAQSVLFDTRMTKRSWVDRDQAVSLFTSHTRGDSDQSEMLWGLINLELWARICLDGDAPESTATEAGLSA